MRIGIIGAGNMGAALAARLTRLGHQVAIANSRGPRTLAGVAAQTGATPVPVTDVTRNADLVIVAIPEKSIPALPAGLFGALPEDRFVIDTGNYVPELRDGHIDAIDAGLPESQWVQSQLRHPVIKAFNTIRPASLASLGKPAGTAGRTAIPVAGDDPAAKSAVLELADQLGFDGLDAGPLAESWRQQPGTPVYTTDLPLDAARQALADATPEQTATWRSQHPQHTQLNTAMHPSSRTGVRFVLTNPSDPSRLDDFTDWYDTYSAAITVPGYLANDIHFENPDANGENNSPRYATIYDIVAPDPATAWPDTEHSPAYPTRLFSDPRAALVSPALRASYALVGSQLQPGQHGPLTGIHVILSNGGDDTERQHREAQILQTGLFYSAARFRIIEGSPEPAEWLEVFETDDPDPLHAYPRATRHTPPAPQIQPQLSQSFRLADARKTNRASAEHATADLPIMRDRRRASSAVPTVCMTIPPASCTGSM
jgi:predicted dinucleotide-binding enzyme